MEETLENTSSKDIVNPATPEFIKTRVSYVYLRRLGNKAGFPTLSVGILGGS